MEDKEILQKAIKKAKENGYIPPINFYKDATIETDGTIDNGEWYENHMTYSIQQIIFSHDFAKAFWGEEKETHWFEFRDKVFCLDYGWMSNWQYHLQKMVLEEPLKYLEKFL